MDFRYSPEDEAFREEVRAFLRDELPPEISAKVREGRSLAKDEYIRWQKTLDARGWVAYHWPEQWGGTGWSTKQKFIFEAEMALAHAPRTIAFGFSMLAPVLIRYGSPEQQSHWLPRIKDSSDWWCQGFSEPGAGSDLAGLRTAAVRDGDHYIVNGQKTWTTLAQFANMMFALVRTASEGRKQEGISFLLIDMTTPGVVVRPIKLIEGGHEVNEVFFSDVRVPAGNLVGEENKGWTYAKYLLSYERTNIAGYGASLAAFRRLQAFANHVTRGNCSLAQEPLFAARLAALAIELDNFHTTNLRVLAAGEGEALPLAESAMLKIRGTEIRQRITALALDAVGGQGRALVDDDRLLAGDWPDDELGFVASAAKSYLNNRKLTIFGGSSEVQRDIISRALLGFLTVEISYSDEQRMLVDTIDRFAAARYAFAERRKIAESEAGWSQAHWRELAELGIVAALLPESAGGLGGSGSDIGAVFGGLGRALVVEPFLGTLMAGRALAAAGGQDPLLEAVIGGETVCLLAHEEAHGRLDPQDIAARAEPDGEGWLLTGAKVAIPQAGAADRFVVSAHTTWGLSLFLVQARADEAFVTAFPAIDGGRIGDLALYRSPALLIGEPGRGAAHVAEALSAGLVALAWEAVAIMDRLREDTIAYLGTRKQFGIPIGQFQALRHCLVSVAIEIEQARSAAVNAAAALSGEATVRDAAASAAKYTIARVGALVAEEAIQMHGGIGMTWELPLSHYAKRLVTIGRELGGEDYHLTRFGALREPA